MKKVELKLMCGLPRAGKSTWLEKNKGDSIIVSPDEIRKEVFGHQFFAPANKFVFGLAESMVNLLLKQQKNVIVDATHITKNLRAAWRMIAINNNADVKIIRVSSSKNMVKDFLYCLEKNELSPENEKVPYDALIRMANAFEEPDQEEEGNWFQIIYANNDFKKGLSLEKRIGYNNNDDIYDVYYKFNNYKFNR